jgi:hypothetical protein
MVVVENDPSVQVPKSSRDVNTPGSGAMHPSEGTYTCLQALSCCCPAIGKLPISEYWTVRHEDETP